ncbi:MAG: YeeE/YedE thiosulfate transporter family protein, partial [Rhodospirillales bacterium]|nr:YeeE/YedE thiosulfate transporter family protein [Rhodospirillales bacterium]
MSASDGVPSQAPQRAVAGAGVAAIVAGALVLGADGWERGAFLVLGGLLGLTLYHAAFGFTSAYRRAFAVRDLSGVGTVAPVAVQVAIGSAMFGLGMQLAGGCGSGTLYTVGGGSTRMVLALAAFCFGGFWATLHFGFWSGLPSLGSISLAESFGWEAALPMQLVLRFQRSFPTVDLFDDGTGGCGPD